jgi:uncharacterized membrane protein
VPFQTNPSNLETNHHYESKRIFGATLTVLGIIGLIYAAIVYVDSTREAGNIKALVIYGMLGLLFFGAGISLVQTTKDAA